MSPQDQYAYLGMYDFPALRPAQDAWWTGLAGHLSQAGFSDVPDGLNRSVKDPYDIWLSPDLFVAQTCGFPLTHELADRVRLLGTPCYDAPACDGPLYRSLFIVSTKNPTAGLGDALPARIAVNGKDSYSGWRVLAKCTDEPLGEIIISGSHAESIDLVRDGTADLAAIDCVTHALIGDVTPERLAGTRILAESPPAPGLPYITRADRTQTDIERMTEAINAAFQDPKLADARRILRLTGFSQVPLTDYERAMKNPAKSLA